MRVLFASNSGFQYFGAGFSAMEEKGIQYRILATDDLKVHQKRWRGVKIRAFQKYYHDDHLIEEYRRILREFAPDVVHITGVRQALIKTLAAVRDFPDIAVVHERISAGGMNIFSPLDWWLFTHHRIDRIVMPSKAMLNNWMGHPVIRRYVPPDICEVLHYPFQLPPVVDAEKRRDMRLALGLDPDAFIVGTVCYVRPWKNAEFVADIVASIETSAPVCFAVVGTAAHDSAYMDRLRAAGGERLKLLGYVKNAANIMPIFDLYVTPTHLPGESFGMAHAEAMSHGVPGLTMNFGASAEVCEDGVSGLTLPFNKIIWRAAILDLMADRTKLRRMGEAARLRIQERFAPSFIADKYLTVYRRAQAVRVERNRESSHSAQQT